jgi:hypothetical protein
MAPVLGLVVLPLLAAPASGAAARGACADAGEVAHRARAALAAAAGTSG